MDTLEVVFTEAQLKYLERIFKVKDVLPNSTTIEEAMYTAGQQSVLKTIRTRLATMRKVRL